MCSARTCAASSSPARWPRGASGRSWSASAGSSQLDLAWRRRYSRRAARPGLTAAHETSAGAVQALDVDLRAAAARPCAGRRGRHPGAARTPRRTRRRSAGTRPRACPRSAPRRSRRGTRRRHRPSRRPRAAGSARGRARLALGRHRREAAVGHGHDRLDRPERDHLAYRDEAILVVVELVADELLGLEHVRRDDVRRCAHGVAQRVAVGVDDDDEAELAQLLDEVRVDVGVDLARQRAGEDHDRGAAREVHELVVEELELARRSRRGRAR